MYVQRCTWKEGKETEIIQAVWEHKLATLLTFTMKLCNIKIRYFRINETNFIKSRSLK